MFASQTTKDVPLPSDPAITVTIRKLSWTQRESAQRAAKKERHTHVIDLGGVDVPEYVVEDIAKRLVDKSVPPPADGAAHEPVATPVEPDLLLTHDKLTVLVCGITAWTVKEPVDKAHIEDLDPDDADALARQILALSVRTETERKNAESGSTGT